MSTVITIMPPMKRALELLPGRIIPVMTTQGIKM